MDFYKKLKYLFAPKLKRTELKRIFRRIDVNWFWLIKNESYFAGIMRRNNVFGNITETILFCMGSYALWSNSSPASLICCVHLLIFRFIDYFPFMPHKLNIFVILWRNEYFKSVNRAVKFCTETFNQKLRPSPPPFSHQQRELRI